MKIFLAFPLAVLLASTPAGLDAQTPQQGPQPRPMIVDYLPQVDSLDKAEEFYHHLLGLESTVGDPRARLGWYPGNAFLNDMYGVAGNVRNFYLRVPVTDLMIEPIQWSEAKGKPLSPRLQDPGAARLVLTVTDIDLLWQRLEKSGVEIVTAGGKPISVSEDGSEFRTLLVKDFSGFFVELVQPSGPSATGPGGAPPTYFISGASIAVTVDDIDSAATFYRDVLGLEVRVSPGFMADAQRLQAFGMKGARYREATVVWPDKTPQMHLIEFKDIDRKPLTPLVPDPNSIVLRINLREDMATTVAKVKASATAQIMNLSGMPFLNGRTQWLMVKGPGGAHLQFVAPAPPQSN